MFCNFNRKSTSMKTLLKHIAIVIFFIGTNGMAQSLDQNPNYKESQVKYIEQKEALTKDQGQTIQDTYEAYDWTENKLKEKNERIQRRHDIRMIRHQRNTICYSSNGYNYNNGYYNNGYNTNNGYYNNGYNTNNGYYNNGCNTNTGGSNYYNSGSNWGNTLLSTAVLGTTLYYLLK